MTEELSFNKEQLLKKSENNQFNSRDLFKLAAAASMVGAAFIGAGGFTYARQVEPDWLEVTHRSMRLPALAPEFHGLRLVQISDIHMDRWMNRKRINAIVDIVNRLKPDIVAITGDFVTARPEKYASDLESALCRLAPSMGTLGVLGNHDHWSNPRLVRKVMKQSGVIDLNNCTHTLQRGQAMLHFGGVDDSLVRSSRLDEVLGRLPSKGAAVLLAHEPDFADISAASGRFDLQLSGHSHGGQIVLPVVGRLYLPPLGQKYPSGLYNIGKMKLYTNRGLGTVHFRMRLNCRPEITVFTLLSTG